MGLDMWPSVGFRSIRSTHFGDATQDIWPRHVRLFANSAVIATITTADGTADVATVLD